MNKIPIKQREPIIITRYDSHFDRACESAAKLAPVIFGIDDCGHSSRVEDWERSSCSIMIEFLKMSFALGMTGAEYTYYFEAWAEKADDV